jgi:DNA-binding CsgD family transcriptional regulator
MRLKSMMTYFDIFSEASAPFASLEESAGYLETAKDKFGVLNLSYWFIGSDLSRTDGLTWLSTYDPGYTSIYMSEYSPRRDPAFSACFRRPLPLDWSEVRNADDNARTIHEIAARYGIGKQGISFPIRDNGSSQAMFSVNFECADSQWVEVRRDLVTVFHLFGHFFHLRLKDLIGRPANQNVPELTPREREVLSWAAEGKTAWETARLLGVSERAVRLYSENAMAKLGAHTKAQAVAIAIRNGMLG